MHLFYIRMFVCTQENFLIDTAKRRNLKCGSDDTAVRPHETFNVDDGDPYREFGELPDKDKEKECDQGHRFDKGNYPYSHLKPEPNPKSGVGCSTCKRGLRP